MPIKTSCSCGFTFNAKNELAGKKVKCPRCTQPLQIPSLSDVTVVSGSGVAAAKGRALNKGLMDLLDEEGVHGIPQGPICQSCGNVMAATSVICVNCGFNTATGEFLETEVDANNGIVAVGETNTHDIMAKAEQEIDDSPITGEGQDFGDGADSYVIALACAAIAGVVLMAGLAVVLAMEHLTSDINPANIAVVVGTLVAVFSWFWIIIMAFFDNVTQGLLCIIPFYAFYYGITKKSGLLFWPAIGLPVTSVIASVSWLYLYMSGA